MQEKKQECGFFYLTRWYRLKTDAEFPEFQPPTVANLGYLSAMAFAADNNHFSLTTVMSVEDPHRVSIRDGATFDRVMAEVPLIQSWIERGEPISEAEPLSRIDNRRRKLVDDSGPIVSGFLLLGDAAVHTNPTLGRGVSLAFMHAQHLAETAEQSEADPVRYSSEFSAWTSKNMGVWFTSQVANDAAALDRLRASLRGEVTTPQPTGEAARFTRALFALASREPDVGLALARIGNLLISPLDIMADQAVVSKVMAYLATNPDLTQSGEGPSRAEFEAIVGAAA